MSCCVLSERIFIAGGSSTSIDMFNPKEDIITKVKVETVLHSHFVLIPYKKDILIFGNHNVQLLFSKRSTEIDLDISAAASSVLVRDDVAYLYTKLQDIQEIDLKSLII